MYGGISLILFSLINKKGKGKEETPCRRKAPQEKKQDSKQKLNNHLKEKEIPP